MPKKVLFFLNSNVGGAERITLTIAKMFPTEQYEVHIVVVDKTYGDIKKFIPEEFSKHLIRIKNIWDFTTVRLCKLLYKQRPYAVFCSKPYISIRLLIAAKIVGGIKVIVRNSNYIGTFQKYVVKMIGFTYKWADHIILQQQDMLNEFVQEMPHLKEKCLALTNPLDLCNIETKRYGKNPYPMNGAINYLWVSRIAYTKGHDILITAFAKVHSKNKYTHLYLVGDIDCGKDYLDKLHKTISDNNLQEYVHFVGFDENPYCWMQNCHCFVLPSRIEGLPNSLIEAMYMNRPVVATLCVPIIKEIIKNGENGYVVPSEDVDTMAIAMLKAIDLRNCTPTYMPSSKEDFLRLF